MDCTPYTGSKAKNVTRTIADFKTLMHPYAHTPFVCFLFKEVLVSAWVSLQSIGTGWLNKLFETSQVRVQVGRMFSIKQVLFLLRKKYSIGYFSMRTLRKRNDGLLTKNLFHLVPFLAQLQSLYSIYLSLVWKNIFHIPESCSWAMLSRANVFNYYTVLDLENTLLSREIYGSSQMFRPIPSRMKHGKRKI